jgi:large subunit ribosomal protein L6
MSKIGRMPINTAGVKVEVKGCEVHFSGKNASGVHVLPPFLEVVKLSDDSIKLDMKSTARQNRKFWGLHRALLFNKIQGANKNFEKQLVIKGLGFKAEVAGKNVKMSLGYSHKIDYVLPEKVTLQVDKTGQNLVFQSFDKELLGKVCDQIRSFRTPEPYKGTGIRYLDEVIIRKAGKTKA